MARICVAVAPDYGINPVGLTTELIRAGHELVQPGELACVGADALIYFMPSKLDTATIGSWLACVNRVRVDALVTDTLTSALPTDIGLHGSILDDPSALATALDQINAAISGSTDEIVPRIVRLPTVDGIPSFGVHQEGALYELLQAASTRVVAVSAPLLDPLRNRTANSSRREYDLARFVRWSKDRLDTAFVKLRLNLAGADSPNSLVSETATSLIDVLADTRTTDLVVLEGAPGSGKTLQLKYLETRTTLASIRSGSLDDSPLAFCVHLGEATTTDKDFDPLEWLSKRWKQRVLTHMGSLNDRIAQGNLIVLLDAFNEIPFRDSRDRQNWMLKWKQCVHEDVISRANNRCVIACRSRDLNIPFGTEDVSPTRVQMAALVKDEILSIAMRRNVSAADKLQKALDADPGLVKLYETPFSLTDYLKYVSGPVPKSQSEIFWRRITATLERERDVKNYQLIGEPLLPEDAINLLIGVQTITEAIPILKTIPLLAALGAIAQDMSQVTDETGTHRTSLEMDAFVSELAQKLNLYDNAAAVHALYGAVDLDLLDINDGNVRFEHQSLQDFFAAATISDDAVLEGIEIGQDAYDQRLGELDAVIVSLGPNDQLQLVPATGFEETFARAVELRHGLFGRAASRNPWLTAERITYVQLAHPERAKLETMLIAELEKRLRATRDIRERIASLTSLSQVGWRHRYQQRAGTFDHLLPTVLIPAGEWNLGCGDRTASVIGSVQPRHTCALPSFFIGQTAVTRTEFDYFIDEGYREERYWTPEGWEWRSGAYSVEPVFDRWIYRRDKVRDEPGKPLSLLKLGKVSILEAAAIIRFGRMTDAEIRNVAHSLVDREVYSPAYGNVARLSEPLQPVVGVSFHEATAYCNWLSEKTGRTVRLPSEDEWEAAALFSRGGEVNSIDEVAIPARWTAAWTNTAELHVGKPTPIGAFVTFPLPATPELPLEMAGNVFEWVTDRVRAGETWSRVVKGGSWRHLMRRAHPGYRGRGDTTTRNDDNGFRIVMEPE